MEGAGFEKGRESCSEVTGRTRMRLGLFEEQHSRRFTLNVNSSGKRDQCRHAYLQWWGLVVSLWVEIVADFKRDTCLLVSLWII